VGSEGASPCPPGRLGLETFSRSYLVFPALRVTQTIGSGLDNHPSLDAHSTLGRHPAPMIQAHECPIHSGHPVQQANMKSHHAETSAPRTCSGWSLGFSCQWMESKLATCDDHARLAPERTARILSGRPSAADAKNTRTTYTSGDTDAITFREPALLLPIRHRTDGFRGR
jgi:hypothetical protein